MRLAAVAHDSVTGLALLHALLAYSSLHRNGSNQQAIRLKIAALQYLSAATRGRSLSSFEAVQHVAASMLLGAYEVGHQRNHPLAKRINQNTKVYWIALVTFGKLRRVAVVYLGGYRYYPGD